MRSPSVQHDRATRQTTMTRSLIGRAPSTTIQDDRLPIYLPLRTPDQRRLFKSMSRIGLPVAHILTPRGITMNLPKGSSSRKAPQPID
ncbi:hypothetical protein FB451DRAFT_1402648 [Mycena latifolia]|nr:hypothetical protein FB451DRAFT_1402648 [Mycena latifolia]